MKQLVGSRLVLVAAMMCAAAVQASAQPPPAAPQRMAYKLSLHTAAKDRKPVPFEPFRHLLLFKARVEGHDVWALLDNGTDHIIIDAAYAKTIGLNLSRQVGQLRTPTGTLDRWLVPDAGIEIPGQISFRGAIFASDLSQMSKQIGRPISLVVGKEMFEGMAVLVRPGDRTFEFWPSQALSLPPQAPRLPLPANARVLVLKNDTPQLAISIDGKPATVAVDLGFAGIMALGESAWDRLGLNDRASVADTSVSADGRTVPTKQTIVVNISIGPVKAYDVSVSEEPVLPAEGDGRLGMAFLSHFNFALDLKAQRIWLISEVSAGSSSTAANAGSKSAHR